MAKAKIIYKCYKITNLINNKSYIGVTKCSLKERFKQHIKVSKGNGKKQSLQKAIIKYGLKNFVIEWLYSSLHRDEIFEKEKLFINMFDTYKLGYNETPGGDDGPHEIKYSTEELEEILLFYINCENLRKTSNHFNIKYHSIFDITRLRPYNSQFIDKKILKSLKEIKSNSPKRKKLNKKIIINMIDDFVNNRLNINDVSIKYKISISNAWSVIHRDTFKNIKIPKKLEDKLIDRLNESRFWKKS